MRIRFLLLPLLAACAVTGAQGQGAPAAVGGETIVGTVHDSLAGAPLVGATVQLVAAADPALVRTTVSGPEGAFTLRDVPEGRYTLGFLHPVLDSIGIEPPVQEVEIRGGAPLRVNLSVPSAIRLRGAVCGGGGDTAAAMYMGTVRNAAGGAPVAGAVVRAAWIEYDLRDGTLTRRLAEASDTSGANGWFGLCGVPRGGTISVQAGARSDSTDVFDVDVPAHGFMRRDVYLGSSRVVLVAATPRAGHPGDGAPVGTDTLHAGDGRLHGTVVTLVGARPVDGARVRIAGARDVRTGKDGEWSLSGIPTGTRLLEVHAVGFAARQVVVDVVDGAAPVPLALTGIQALLDTVRVTASRFRLVGTGFDERSRSGMGRYLSSSDVLRRAAMFTSDALKTVPGLRVDRSSDGDTQLTMRGAFGRCSPAVYLDGHWVRGLTMDDIDAFVPPDRVAGMEVYSGAIVPPQFQPGMTGCGSVVIWTKPGESPVRGWSMARQALHGIGAIALGVGIGAFLEQRR